jgi:hypothetical protein
MMERVSFVSGMLADPIKIPHGMLRGTQFQNLISATGDPITRKVSSQQLHNIISAAESMVLTGLRGTASRSELIGIKRLFEKEFGRMEAAANRCCDLTDALLEEATEELERGFPDPIQRVKGKKSKIVQGEMPTPKDLQKGFIQ